MTEHQASDTCLTLLVKVVEARVIPSPRVMSVPVPKLDTMGRV